MNSRQTLGDVALLISICVALSAVYAVDVIRPKPTRPTLSAEGSSGERSRGSLLSAGDPYTEFKGLNSAPDAQKDRYGNPDGSKYDLAKDGAFRGLKIAVIHLYTGEGCDFGLAKTALEEKGFSVQRWADYPPSPEELEIALRDSCQLWIISDQSQKLNSRHLAIIKTFFESGRGVFIWGDNHPYYADANAVAATLFGGRLSGDLQGDQVVGVRSGNFGAGIAPNHPITTGLENLYEGITIATVQEHPDLQTILYGSAGNATTAAFDKDRKRALLDGGYTRLFFKWDTAGTGRYVKNAAAWLVNYERFGADLFKDRDRRENR